MKSVVLSQFTISWLPTLALVLFLIIFGGMIIWINRKGSKRIYGEHSQLPLTDGNINE